MFTIGAAAACACSPAVGLDGWEAWTDGAVGVPTDVRLVVYAASLTPEVTLVGDGAPVDTAFGTGLWDLARERHPVTPVELLAPDTLYRATVAHDDDVFTATFTTGDGPAGHDFAPPTLRVDAVSDWELDDAWFLCTLGSPVLARTLSVTIELDEAPPPGSYVAVRSRGAQGDFDALEVAEGVSVASTFRQGEHEDRPDAAFASHDCLTPVFLAPSGAEVEGTPVCVEPPGCGCATANSPASAALAAAAAVWWRARRRSRGGWGEAEAEWVATRVTSR